MTQRMEPTPTLTMSQTSGKKRTLEDDGSLSSSSSSSTCSSSLPLKKRIHRMVQLELGEQGPLNKPNQNGSKRPRFLHVHWSPLKPQVHHDLEHPDFEPSLVWYSRQEYDNFMADRMRTVKSLRANEGVLLDPHRDSVRGLEPFQTAKSHHDMHSKRQFHNATILLEQVRQSRLNKEQRDPARFRELVSLQSEIALTRAQQLARSTVEDSQTSIRRSSAYEGVNNAVNVMRRANYQQQNQLTQQQQYHLQQQQQQQQRRQSASEGTSRPSYERRYGDLSQTNTMPVEPPSIFECGKLPPTSDRVRQLQQLHAQKLIHLYQKNVQTRAQVQTNFNANAYSHTSSPSSVMSTYALPVENPLMDSYFPVRRDSVYGGMGRTNGNGGIDLPIANLPSVRRASLASARSRMALRRGSWQGIASAAHTR